MKKLTLAAASALTLALAVPMVAQAHGFKGGGRHHERFADTNGDGVIAKAEVEAAAYEAFGKIDTNKDGFATQAELKAGHEAQRAEMKAKWEAERAAKEPGAEVDPAKAAEREAKRAERKAKWDAGADERKAKMETRGAEHFAALDKDSDGRLSQAEFTAPKLEKFAKVDTDGDGSISAAELEVVKGKMKERRGKWRDKPAEQ